MFQRKHSHTGYIEITGEADEAFGSEFEIVSRPNTIFKIKGIRTVEVRASSYKDIKNIKDIFTGKKYILVQRQKELDLKNRRSKQNLVDNTISKNK